MFQSSLFRKIFLSLIILLLSGLVISQQKPAELVDDGAFFLRYAENMLKGKLWFWNINDGQIWGASAPFYPFVLALGLLMSSSPQDAAILVGTSFYLLTLSSMTIYRISKANLIFLLSFLSFYLLNSSLKSWSLSGLETPLTLFLCSLCFCGLKRGFRPAIQVALASGLMLHKIDLIPIGYLFLLCFSLKENHFSWIALSKKLIYSSTILLAWHCFAWVYFDSPLPNSFQTKFFHQKDFVKLIDSSWFCSFLFLHHSHIWMSVLAIFSFILYKRLPIDELPSIIFALGIILIHSILYTIYHPFEPYNWYVMPALFALIFLASLGVSAISKLSLDPRIQLGLSFLILLCILRISYPIEKQNQLNWNGYLSLFEKDRADAGRWVSEHTPQDFVVLTGWGNPALYSQRKVIDSSFLQKKFEDIDLVKQYQPEIIIFQGSARSTPAQPEFRILNAQTKHKYVPIQFFSSSYEAGHDYFFTVLARKDIVPEIKN